MFRVTPLERAPILSTAAEAGLTLGQHMRHELLVGSVDCDPDAVYVKNLNPKPGDRVYIRADVAKEAR